MKKDKVFLTLIGKKKDSEDYELWATKLYPWDNTTAFEDFVLGEEQLQVGINFLEENGGLNNIGLFVGDASKYHFVNQSKGAFLVNGLISADDIDIINIEINSDINQTKSPSELAFQFYLDEAEQAITGHVTSEEFLKLLEKKGEFVYEGV